MNPNQKKKFTDQFRNPNGSYHIPTWLIVVMFINTEWNRGGRAGSAGFRSF